MRNTAILMVSCPDRKGLVARISEFIFRHDGNILDFDQQTDLEAGVFLARVEWQLDEFDLDRGAIARGVSPAGRRVQHAV